MKKRIFSAVFLLAAAALLLAGCAAKYSYDNERLNYNITGQALENATLYVTRKGEKVTRAAEGDILYVNLLPETGYERESITVNGEKLTGSQFTMPAGDVKVEATVRPVTGTITIDTSITGGTVTADKTSAMYGETVTLTISPDAEYALLERSLTVNDAEIFRGKLTEKTQVTFRMPPHDVTISARFKDNTLHISTVAEYLAFAAQVNAGTDFKGRRVFIDNDIGSAENPVEAILGNASDKAFAGTIEGSGHTIYLKLTGTRATALIGYANGAAVKNLTVAGSVTLTAGNFYAGGFVGMVQWANGNATTLENCINKATIDVTASSNAGGLVGRALGNLTVTGCENAGSVTTKGNYAAGIVAYVINSSAAGAGAPAVTITNTVNSGSITAAGNGVGGIVGLFHKGAAGAAQRLTNVSNTGALAGASQVGGIVGVITDQATDGFDIQITYRAAGLYDAEGNDIVVGADKNKKTTLITKLTSPDVPNPSDDPDGKNYGEFIPLS